MPRNIGVLVSGRGSNLQAIIDAIADGQLDARIAVVISNRADAQGLDRARAAGIETLVRDHKRWPSRDAYEAVLVEDLRARDVHLVCLAGFMRLLGATFVDAFPNRILNIHPALLPSFPGLHAQRQALEHGVRVSGCSVHLVDSGTDTGPIILQRCVRVEQDDTEESLADRILEEEHRILPEAVRLFMEGRLNVQGRRVRIR